MKRKIIFLVMPLLLGFGYSNAQYGPVVSFTYDDGFSSWYDVGLPIFQEYGFPGVVYINATNGWVQSPGALDKLHEMQAAGWEISSHAYYHDSTLNESNISANKDWLDANGFPNSGFASPQSFWDHSLVNIVKRYHPYYAAYPTLDGGLSQPFDLYFTRRFSLTNADDIETIKGYLDDAVANNKWIIFYGHDFGGTYGDPNDLWFQSEELLRKVFDEIAARGIPVKTVREVITDLFPPGCVIECSRDTMQYPVLTYFEEGDSSLNTSVWNEYWHSTFWTGPHYVGSPVVYYHTSNDSLPVMKFYHNVPNGEYDVRASIIAYDPDRTYRLYYSFDSLNTLQYSVDVNKNSDVSLGTVTVTNGQFALYTQKADMVSDGDGYVGWAFIKLFAKPLSLNLKVFLEGPYNGSGEMRTTLYTQGLIPPYQPYKLTPWNYLGTEAVATFPTNVVDWVMIELRSNLTTIVSRRAGLLLSDGSVVDIDGFGSLRFPGISNGNYYIVIYHRNHLPIMSANPVTLLTGSSVSYDFSTSQMQAYGNEPMVDLGGGLFGMIAGDTNISAIITAADITPIIVNLNLSDYNDADVNMSGIVTAADITKIISNLNKATNVPN
jgi:peptidoglycan/xylan/chitin deacetylase (PgdA/CDA1 family)